MPASSAFFMIMAGLMTLVGLFGATVAEGYLYAFSMMLMFFGLFYGYSVIKRYYDLKDAERH